MHPTDTANQSTQPSNEQSEQSEQLDKVPLDVGIAEGRWLFRPVIEAGTELEYDEECGCSVAQGTTTLQGPMLSLPEPDQLRIDTELRDLPDPRLSVFVGLRPVLSGNIEIATIGLENAMLRHEVGNREYRSNPERVVIRTQMTVFPNGDLNIQLGLGTRNVGILQKLKDVTLSGAARVSESTLHELRRTAKANADHDRVASQWYETLTRADRSLLWAYYKHHLSERDYSSINEKTDRFIEACEEISRTLDCVLAIEKENEGEVDVETLKSECEVDVGTVEKYTDLIRDYISIQRSEGDWDV